MDQKENVNQVIRDKALEMGLMVYTPVVVDPKNYGWQYNYKGVVIKVNTYNKLKWRKKHMFEDGWR